MKSICGQLSRASHLTTDVNTQSLISSDFFHSVRKGREGKGNMHISKLDTGLVFHLIPPCCVFTVFFLLCTGLNLIQRLVSIGLSENIFYSNLWTALFLSFEIT